jgi:threonine/homoserine/homoserine lactone efflux protein
MSPLSSRHSSRPRRILDLTVVGVIIAVFALWLVPGWGLTAEIFFVITMVVGAAWLGYLAWALATGRAGLNHWAPAARRQRRLERHAAKVARAHALVQQQRLAAALSHGPYQPHAGSPPGSGPGGVKEGGPRRER